MVPGGVEGVRRLRAINLVVHLDFGFFAQLAHPLSTHTVLDDCTWTAGIAPDSITVQAVKTIKFAGVALVDRCELVPTPCTLAVRPSVACHRKTCDMKEYFVTWFAFRE